MTQLTVTGPYTAKDQVKANRATKFIGCGSIRSSTNRYMHDFGALANSGEYTRHDIVFISAEGLRNGRLLPDFAEINCALMAGATIITDAPIERIRPYNIGEEGSRMKQGFQAMDSQDTDNLVIEHLKRFQAGQERIERKLEEITRRLANLEGGQASIIQHIGQHLGVLPLVQITESIAEFLEYAAKNPKLPFFVTRVGCGLAGYTDDQIGPLFKNAQANCSLPDVWQQYVVPQVKALAAEPG